MNTSPTDCIIETYAAKHIVGNDLDHDIVHQVLLEDEELAFARLNMVQLKHGADQDTTLTVRPFRCLNSRSVALTFSPIIRTGSSRAIPDASQC